MGHQFTNPPETLDDPRFIEDVVRLRNGVQEGHRVTAEFYHKGVSILEVVSRETPRHTEEKNEKVVTRRILILGHAVNSGEVVTLHLKDHNNSCTSHHLQFGVEKPTHHPEVLWCKGLAMVHTGNSLDYKETNQHRMKHVTALMKLVWDVDNRWYELNFRAMRAMIDSFEVYLDPRWCSKTFRGIQKHGMSAYKTPPRFGLTMPSESPPSKSSSKTYSESSTLLSPTTKPLEQRETPHEHVPAEKQASDHMHRTTGGKTITPELQLLIDQQYKDDHYPANDHYVAVADDQGGQEKQRSLDQSTTTTRDAASVQTSRNSSKRTYDMAFSTNPDSMSLAMAKRPCLKKEIEGPEEVWERILTDMERLTEVYQEFANLIIDRVDPPVGRVKALDMAEAEKPTSFPGCAQRLMASFTATALQECIHDAFDALDYDIADSLCKASRALRSCLKHAYYGGTSANRVPKRAGKEYLAEAEKYLLIWEQMIEGDAEAKDVNTRMVLDLDNTWEQLTKLAFATEEPMRVVTMRYIKAIQACRARETFQEFLAEIKPMTKALASAFEDLEGLQE